PAAPGPRRMIGRGQERAALWQAFEAAAGGNGRVVCLTGEPGLGKTTLVEDFFAELNASGRLHAGALGRCSERLAGADAYRPRLEALQGLPGGEAGDAAARPMQAVAPSWYAQVARAADSAGTATPLAASQERMKAEMRAFLEQMCRLRPVTLILDDIH